MSNDKSRSSSRNDPRVSPLNLPEELLLVLLDEESGYFRQVPGWNLNCVMAGAALGELSLLGRVDTDLQSLILVDSTDTGHPLLDPFLREIASEEKQHNARYWVERLAMLSESIILLALDRLVHQKILDHHPGRFLHLHHATTEGNTTRRRPSIGRVRKGPG